MKLFSMGKKEWTNRHETFTEKIKDLFVASNEPALGALDSYNDAVKALQTQVAKAVQTGMPLRMLGAGWSWTKIATAKDGIMIDTKPLNVTLAVSPSGVVPAYKGDVRKLVLAQCGCAIWELSRDLRDKGLSLKTSGASNGQTIAGAIATGAHGSTIDVGAVQDCVVGLHLIVGSTRHIWLERKSYPVASSSLIQKLKTELVQDDELFNAALVSFGSFGIVHGVLLETEDLFLLETHMQRRPYDAALRKTMETLDFNNIVLPHGHERPFHLSISLNPYDLQNGAFVYSHYKRPYRENYKRPVPNEAGIGPGDDAPCFIGKLTDAVPGFVPTLVSKLLAGVLKPYTAVEGTLGEIFNNTTLHGKLLSCALGIPINQINRVTDLLLELNKTAGPFPGLFAYRFVKKSGATLAFTRYDFTCILELDGAFSDDTLSFYTAARNKLEAEGIPFTFHWGKMNELDFNRISRMYGSSATSWIAARNKLLDEATMKVFTNPLLTQWGLDKVLPRVIAGGIALSV
jgi:hypothetical protein